jgi:hypothetical protein
MTLVGVAQALPPGRAWAGPDSLRAQRFSRFSGVLLESDDSGNLRLASAGFDSTGSDAGLWALLRWSDRGWSLEGSPIARAGFAATPVVAHPSSNAMSWLAPAADGTGRGYLLFSGRTAQGLERPDTALVTTQQSSEYGSASGGRRRWAVRSEQRLHPRGNTTFAVRTAFSDGNGVWRELPLLGSDEFMCAIAPLGSRGALIVHAGIDGLAWAQARDARWLRTGVLDPRPDVPLHPRLSVRPAGGAWLTWTDKVRVHVAVFEAGAWTRQDSVVARHSPGETFWSAWCDLSRDDGPLPVLAWGDRGVGATLRDVLCVAIPDSNAWAEGEEVPGSEGAFIPSVARDRQGDVWVAWSPLRAGGVYWNHTYVSATVQTFTVTRERGGVRLEARLSQPAPGSEWQVERSSGSKGFERVQSLRAGPGIELVWWDPSPASTEVAYRIRRPTLDTRFDWVSQVVRP